MWLYRWTGRDDWFQNCRWTTTDAADVWWVPCAVDADGSERMRFCRLVPIEPGTIRPHCVPVDTHGYRLPSPCVALIPADGMLPVEEVLRHTGPSPIGVALPQPFPSCLPLDVARRLVSGVRWALRAASRAVPSPGVLPLVDEAEGRTAVAEEWAGGSVLLWVLFRMELVAMRSQAPLWRAAVMEEAPSGNAVVREAQSRRKAQAVRQAIGDDLSATEHRTAVLTSTAMQGGGGSGGDRRSNDGYVLVLFDTWRRPMTHLALEIVRYLRHMAVTGALDAMTHTVVCNGWDPTEWLTLYQQTSEELLGTHAVVLRVVSEVVQFMAVLHPATGALPRAQSTRGRSQRQHQRAKDLFRHGRLSIRHEFELSGFLAATDLRVAVLTDLILGCMGYPSGCLRAADCRRFAQHAATYVEGFMAL